MVIDHFGLYGDTTPADANGRRLLDLVALSHVWVKLSAPYRMSPARSTPGLTAHGSPR